MLRFGAHVSCRLFRAEIALVLHHASQWSEIAGDVVTVIALGEYEALDLTRTPVDLSVELAIGELEDAEPWRLAGYLSRILAASYAIIVEQRIVRVFWDPRRGNGTPGHGAHREPAPDA